MQEKRDRTPVNEVDRRKFLQTAALIPAPAKAGPIAKPSSTTQFAGRLLRLGDWDLSYDTPG